MSIIKEKNILFIHIPRTGGSSVEKCFDVYRSHNNLYGRKEIDGKLYALQHLSLQEHVKFGYLNNPGSYFKFAFVRNPWDRIVSAYSFQCRRSKKCEFKDFVEISAEYVINNKLLLSENKYDVLKRKHGISLVHLIPQVNFIKHPKHKINFIGKYETFQKDLQKILNKFQVKNSIPKINKSNHRCYSDYYDDNLIKIVTEMYDEDISLFKYCF